VNNSLTCNLSGVTPDIARHVLAHYGQLDDRSAEAFLTPLISAIAHADAVNQGLLATVYPGYVEAVVAAKSRRGIKKLRQIAGGDLG
jgi:hypothetical protein